MGQYYKGVNLDKREFIQPHDYDNGAKLMEHSYIENPLLDTVEHLFSPKGNWYKTRFVWTGDVISMEKSIPEGFKEIVPDFLE